MKIIFLVLLLFVSLVHQAQDFSKERLLTMGDEELLELFIKVSKDSLIAEKVARVYLNRAREEGDTIKMARGYDRLARIFHPEKNIRYADSVIELTKDLNDKTYPALGFIIKSYQFGRLNDLKGAVENAISGYDFALLNKNIPQQIYISDYLIFTKAIWGDKKEALALQKDREKLINDNDFKESVRKSTRAGAMKHVDDLILENELSSLQNFVFCYLNLRELDSASIFLSKGLKKSKLYGGYSNHSYYYTQWFNAASVEVEFYSGNFLSSIKKVDSILNHKKRDLSKSMIMNLTLFKGLSFIELGKDAVGIEYLKQTDSIFDSTENILLQPDQRALFDELMKHFKSKGDLEGEIKYLNKLIYTDSVFKRNYQFFEPGIIRNFETPRMLKEKEELIKELRSKNDISRGAIQYGLLVLAIMFVIIGYYFKRQLVFRKRFKELIEEKSSRNKKGTSINSKSMELSTKIIDSIMSNLAEFESEKQFLSQKVSLGELANSFNTNTRYLSKVINFQLDKGFPQYINDLRVDYALKELTQNRKFRKFTIKAIASDCGFKSSESFSKAFYKRHGIFPSYYIKKIEALSN